MKRFIVSILCVSVFFIGLGVLTEKAGARSQSDEKALALIKQARAAIGGDAAIAEIHGMMIVGRTINTFSLHGSTVTEAGEKEIALQLPDRMSKIVRIGKDDGDLRDNVTSDRHDIVIMRKGEVLSEIDADEFLSHDGKRVIVRRDATQELEQLFRDNKDNELTTSDGRKVLLNKKEGSTSTATVGDKLVLRDKNGTVIAPMVAPGTGLEKSIIPEYDGPRQNEMLRLTLSLLLSAPEGIDVVYTFAGEGEVDGSPVNIVNAEFAGSAFKLHLSKTSSLPVMVSYVDTSTPKVIRMRREAKAGEVNKDTTAFVRNAKGAGLSTAEYQVRFSDYRVVNGVQLPFRWTTSIGGRTSEIFDVTSYEINPANLSEKFRKRKIPRVSQKDGI